MIRCLALLAFTCAWAACGGDRPQAAQLASKSSSSRAPDPATPQVADKPRTAPPKRTLTRPDLQQLLDTWLKAQNDGDYEAYEALYAPGMHGVKRVGERESRMDRAQWMKDRARMFRKKMEVEAHTVSFRSFMVTAAIEFVQVFHSGKFMDSGPKRLLIRMHDGAPRIMQEEMMHSDVMFQKEAFQDRVYLAFQVGDATYVALHERAEASWGTGKFAIEGTRETNKPYAQQVDVSMSCRRRSSGSAHRCAYTTSTALPATPNVTDSS